MSRTTTLRCPVCGRPVEAPPAGSAGPPPEFPFCSPRCRLLDLGKWLRGEYRIPGAPVEPEASPARDPEKSEYAAPPDRSIRTEEPCA